MRSIISRVCEIVGGQSAGSDMEEVCRAGVVESMRCMGRLMNVGEMEKFITPIVEDETLPDVEQSIDGDVVDLSDMEYDALPEANKAMDGEDKKVVYEGKVYTAKLHEDTHAAGIAGILDSDIKSAVRMAQVEEPVDYDVESLYSMEPDGDVHCPNCGSLNMTTFYVDGGSVAAHCNDCDTDSVFALDEIPFPDDDVDVVTQTEEDIYDIVPGSDMNAHIWYDGGECCYCCDLYSGEGLIESTNHVSFDCLSTYLQGVADAYACMRNDMNLYSTSGKVIRIESVDGDNVTTEGGIGSRPRLAVRIASKDMFLVEGDRYTDKVEVGDLYKNTVGDVMEVVASGDKVRYLYHDIHHEAACGNDMMQEPVQEFLKRVDEGGFVLL